MRGGRRCLGKVRGKMFQAEHTALQRPCGRKNQGPERKPEAQSQAVRPERRVGQAERPVDSDNAPNCLKVGTWQHQVCISLTD